MSCPDARRVSPRALRGAVLGCRHAACTGAVPRGGGPRARAPAVRTRAPRASRAPNLPCAARARAATDAIPLG